MAICARRNRPRSIMVAVAVATLCGSHLGVPPAAAAQPQSNDDYADAEVISGWSGYADGDAAGATAEPGEQTGSGRTLWYQWTAPDSGTIEFNAWGYAEDNGVRAWEGNSFASLKPITSQYCDYENPYRCTRFKVTSGRTYYVQLRLSRDEPPGTRRLLGWRRIIPPAPATNDDFADAQVIPANPDGQHSFASSRVAATAEPGEPQHAGDPNAPAESVWFVWTAPYKATVSITTYTEWYSRTDCYDSEHRLAVYLGKSITRLRPVASDSFTGWCGGASVTFKAKPRKKYKIAVDATGHHTWESSGEVPKAQGSLVAERLKKCRPGKKCQPGGR